MNRFLRDCVGSVMVEFTLVFPIVLMVTLGTVDVTYMLYEWALASKAVYRGARLAIVSDPVATGITNLTWDPTLMGNACIKSDGTPNNGTPPTDGSQPTIANCPTVTTVCTPSSTTAGACTDGYSFSSSQTAFPTIFAGMQQIFPRLQPQNVQISYQTTGLGFVGRPDGLPMEVTVSIRCMTHQFYFIGALMGWLFSSPSGCDPAPAAGLSIPAFASTLPSEGMGSDGS